MNTLLYAESIKLLFAEDEQDYLEEFTSQLREDYNYQKIDIADSEKQAIEKFRQSLKFAYSYDFIITDLKMETIKSGLEIIKEVKSKHPSTEVIILTAHDVSEYREEALQIGALDYILKSSSGDIVDLVHQIIQRAIAAKQKEKVSDNFDSEIDTEKDFESIDVEEDIVVRMQPLSQRQVKIRGKHLGRAQLRVVYDENLD